MNSTKAASIIKRQIRADIKDGTLPQGVSSWQELGDHVDPDEYFGQVADLYEGDIDSKEFTAVCDKAEAIVDQWLRQNR